MRARLTGPIAGGQMLHPRGRLRFQSAIGLSITARCPISCDHCIVGADRHRTEEMSGNFAAALVREAAASASHRADAVIVTGGEPFFAPTVLERVLTEAAAAGLVSLVVTNCYWASSEEKAQATLSRYPGIDLLSVSTDRFHQQHVTLKSLGHAVAAARRLAIPFSVAVTVGSDHERSQYEAQLAGLVDPERILWATTLPAGRAASLEGAPPRGAAPDGPCGGADYPIVFPDGRVIGCQGIVSGLPAFHPLLLGDARRRPLREILRNADGNVFLHAMRALGPGAFRMDSDDHAHAVRIPEAYAKFGRCALCYAMAAEVEVLADVLARLRSAEVAERTAWARLYYLGEDEMARQLPAP